MQKKNNLLEHSTKLCSSALFKTSLSYSKFELEVVLFFYTISMPFSPIIFFFFSFNQMHIRQSNICQGFQDSNTCHLVHTRVETVQETREKRQRQRDRGVQELPIKLDDCPAHGECVHTYNARPSKPLPTQYT